MEASEAGKEKTTEMRGRGWGRASQEDERIKVEEEEEAESEKGRRCRRRRDRPEFVQLGESVSSGTTSQNGQTQTEERKMDMRGCTKGKRGGRRRRGKTQGGRHRHRICQVWRVRERRKWMRGPSG